MIRFYTFIFIFFISVGIALSQNYRIEISVNSTPVSTDNSIVSVAIDTQGWFSRANNFLSYNEQLFAQTYSGSNLPTNITLTYGGKSSIVPITDLIPGGYTVGYINGTMYGNNFPYFKIYYATPNVNVLKVFNDKQEDIFSNFTYSRIYCGGDVLKIVHNEIVTQTGVVFSQEHVFEARDPLNTITKENFNTKNLWYTIGDKFWNYTVPSNLVHPDNRRVFRANTETYPGGQTQNTPWSVPSGVLTFYHQRPKMSILSTYADCSGAKRFVISITGAPVGASTGIQFYGLSGKYTTSIGAMDAIQFSGNTVKQIYSPGVYTFTGQDIPLLTAGASITLTGENWYQSVINVCATSIVVPIPYPEFNFDNITSVTTATRSNGFDVSCYGTNDGRISFTGTNITSMSAVNDAGTVYPLTRNGNVFSKNDFYGGTYSMRVTDNLGCESGYFYIFTVTSPVEIKLTTTTRPLATCISNYQPAEIYCRILQASNNYNVSWLGYQYRYRLYKASNPTVVIYDISTTNTNVVFSNIYTTGDYIVDVQESRGCSITNSHQNVNITNGGNLALRDSVLGNYNGYNIRCNGQINNIVFTFSGFNYNPNNTNNITGVGLDGPPGGGGRTIQSYRVITTPGAGFIIVTVNGVSAGNHLLYVNDDLNCNIIKSFTLTEPKISTISGIRTIIPNTCYGSTNAVYGYTVTGGVPPFNNVAIWNLTTGWFLTYRVGVQSYPNHTNTFTGLPDFGDNTNAVMLGPDGNNCTYNNSSNFTYFNNYFPSPITFTASTTGVTCKGNRNGSLFPISISGGNGQYFGKIYNSSFDSIPTRGQVYANNLPEDIY